VIEPRPGHWDASIISNPAPAIDPKTGNILLIYKSSTEGLTPPLMLGVAMAENPQEPYHRLSEEGGGIHMWLKDGVPTHLFAATGTGPKAWQFDRTWNMAKNGVLLNLSINQRITTNRENGDLMV
jgi:hypothetical protein